MSTSSFGVRGKVYDEMSFPCRRESNASREIGPPPSRGRQVGRGRRIVWWIIALLLCFALWQLTSAGWVHAKATLAQHLIGRSWEHAKQVGMAKRPWPWADTRAVARLKVPAHGIELFVLDGTSARSLAFGPGHVNGTAAPGSSGNSVILAHRDTHFAFLRDLALNEEITVETPTGALARYRVREVTVVDKNESRLLDAADAAQLTLITCYPFEAVAPGTPLRYVVIAERVA